MKFLAKLEKKQFIWWVVALCMFFFFLRLPSLIEPYWYGDEGIYEVVGQAMDHGRVLYRDIWDNKPPLLYVVYALAHGDQPTVKIISLVFGLLSLAVFFFLSQKMFGKLKVSIGLSALYMLLLGTPLFEGNIANAEDFILLPILTAGLMIFTLTKNSYSHNHTHQKGKLYLIHNTQYMILAAGLLLGIAFLFKIVAIFDFAAFLLFFLFINVPGKVSWSSLKSSFKKINIKHRSSVFYISCLFLLGFILPLIITIIYFVANHALSDFYQSAFSGNVDYVGWKNSFLGIPQGLLLLKLLLLIVGLFLIFWKRKYFTKPALFITLWLIFSLFNAYFSGRPYTHYALVMIPSFCLSIGLFFTSHSKKMQLGIAGSILIIITMIDMQFQPNIIRSYQYYLNAIQFVTNQESVKNYETFFDKKVPRDYAIASFITAHTTPSDRVFIWGNNPQIYALSHKLPPTKYTVAYHIIQNNAYEETQQAIIQLQPKYIIVLKETQPLPFAAPLYIMRYNIEGTNIYERSF